jgi:hypothetical protein
MFIVVKFICSGNYILVELLIVKYKADINKYFDDLMYSSFEGNNSEIVKLLLISRDLGIGDIGDFLYEEISDERYDIVKVLFDYGGTSSIYDHTNDAFIQACQDDQIKIANLLLEYGADVSYKKHSALEVACEKCNYNIIGLLLDRGTKISKKIFDKYKDNPEIRDMLKETYKQRKIQN